MSSPDLALILEQDGHDHKSMDWDMSDKGRSAVRRHFAQYGQQQEMHDDIQLGWECGICFETAEDPCVTRCGHLYCQSHLNHWLATHPSCPVCKSFCTPLQDVVPIFSRGRISPPSSPPSSPRKSPSPPPSPPPRHHISPIDTSASYSLAHYLGIALRVLGLAILLAVLLR